jgi:hypothetical protein
MAKVNWKTASNRRVIGDWVELKSLEGIDARVKPRKYSQAGADEINTWAVQRQARLKRETVKAIVDRESSGETGTLKDDAILDVLANADPEMLKQAHYMRLLLKYGIAEYDFGTESGSPSDEWMDAVLDDTVLATEILAIARDFNGPLAEQTSGTSGTSPSGSSKE